MKHVLMDLIAQIPDPGGGEAPPGSDGLRTILRWAAWIAFAVCVLGAVITGGRMAVDMRGGIHGGGGEHMARLGWVLAGTIIVGAASALVGALI